MGLFILELAWKTVDLIDNALESVTFERIQPLEN
jgi:hypothetical protein